MHCLLGTDKRVSPLPATMSIASRFTKGGIYKAGPWDKFTYLYDSVTVS